MGNTTVEYTVNCKRCGNPIGYSGMMYERMKDYGHSRPEYCETCRVALTMEKMTMGAAYFTIRPLPGIDLSEAIPGELGKVYHPDRPHVKIEKIKAFDASKFGATPGKVVEIYEWLKDPNHQVVIVKGGTGSGKSTALPYWLVNPPEGVPEDFFIRDGQIVITQPRIVATTGVSKYLGSLMGSTVGKGFDIGYRYSKDRNADKTNAAFMATDGTLINMIKKGELADLSVVMIDEAHERSLNIDIILHLLKDQLPLYPHLKLLIVSATINAESFLDYFGRETATLVEFEPKSKFIYIGHFADESEKIDYSDMNKLKKQLVPALVKKTIWLLKEQAEGRKGYGHVLGFLQGVKPIEEAVSAIRQAVAADPALAKMVEVLPLYSALPEAESDYTINVVEPSKIRVIIATNVAEASITVEGVIYVIESGVENQSQWEVADSKQTVELRLISKANAKQRYGRSGRTRNGEVFTLYTEAQFDKMLDFPIPAIQRSSMEEIILRLKELGIDDYEEDWIDAPVKAELDRSITSLKNSGAIDDRDMLTEYGALLSQFQYPASLADLMLLADRFGCGIEVASLLPLIKNGGFRSSFLTHETNWDEPTKQKVEQVQKVLWEGCSDDVEFFFRMYSLYENTPDICPENGKQKDIYKRRESFAKAFYVNFDVFEKDILPERDNVLRLLSGHRKDKNNRQVMYELLERTRTILAFCIPFESVFEENYRFCQRLTVPDGTSAACQLAISPDRAEQIAKLKEQKVSALKLALESVAWDSSAEELENIKSRLSKKPELPVIDNQAFENFVDKHKIGDELLVDVVGYAEHSGDFRVSLEVADVETGYKTWMTATDLCFSQSSAVPKQIPVGSKLRVLVKSIESEKGFVQFYRLPFVESWLDKFHASQRKVDGQIALKSKAIDVRTDNKVVFLGDDSKVDDGNMIVVLGGDKVLGKPANEFKIGDGALVLYRLESDFEFKANLPAVSEKLKDYLESPNCRLSLIDGKLSYRGKMKYSDVTELAKIDPENTIFLGALDFLYLSSNICRASKVSDSGWVELAREKFTSGNVAEATVMKITTAGLIVSLSDNFVGFIRLNRIPEDIHEGDVIKAKVVDFNEVRQQVNLNLIVAPVSPTIKFAKGSIVFGIVDKLTDYGAFVNLGSNFSGLIHISKMGRGVKSPSEILRKGDRVEVLVLDTREENGRWKISLELKCVVSGT